MAPRQHHYSSPDQLAEALCAGVAAVLAGGIATRGVATLAVSGGSTPKRFFRHLSQADIAWDAVTVTLVDERWVEPGDERSNERLVRENLLQGPAARARFEPLFEKGIDVDAAQSEVSRRLLALPRPLDAVILGMGSDGHTASFFPGGDRLGEALDLANPAGAIPMRAPDAGEPRMTLTLSRFADAGFLAVHIEGEEKRRVLDRALAGSDTDEMPVRAVFALDRPIEIFWAP